MGDETLNTARKNIDFFVTNCWFLSLINRWEVKNVQDFEEIYVQYFSKVYKFVLTLCQNSSLSEEITQETFFKALKSINKFNQKCKLETWLCKIAKNTYFDYLKKHGLKAEYPLENLSYDYDTEERFFDKETAYDLHKVLHRLKEPYKEVFLLRVFCELSFLQIGELFEKSENWARVTYYRAKLLIKEESE